MELRPLGKTDIRVSAVAMGCWPIAGLTSPGVNDCDSLATLAACFDLGVNHLDTAYCYGLHGESEQLIARAIAGRRDAVVLATKAGIHWDDAGQQVRDATPATLRRECETSLRRLGTDHVELLYLHAPDPTVPIAESAGELKRLQEEGKAQAIGVSNVSLAQLQEFAAVCPVAAFQPPYNMLQRQIEADMLPWCRENSVAVLVYWPLAKGLLAGRLPRDLTLPEGDNRRKYPMYRGAEWEKNVDLVDSLQAIAEEANHTVAELVIAWTIHRPGITAALCGAKRPGQIRETAGGAGWKLTPQQLEKIARALAARGVAAVTMPT